MLTLGFAWLNKGTIVSPEWPPMTGMVNLDGFFSPIIVATKVSERTTVEGRDTEQTGWVEDTSLLEHLGGNGHS